VDDIINSPPQQNPYTTLKTELIKQLCPSKDQCTRQLFTLEELGDQKPSQFLRHLKSLEPDIPDNYLRILWTSRLPTNIRTILAGLPEVGLESAALCDDRVLDIISPTTVATTTLNTDNTDILQSIRDLPRQIAKYYQNKILLILTKVESTLRIVALVPDLAVPTHPHDILDALLLNRQLIPPLTPCVGIIKTS
jgi:hypothetical protein